MPSVQDAARAEIAEALAEFRVGISDLAASLTEVLERFGVLTPEEEEGDDA
jgi:uncharacterized coiled-coil protein SlyX